LTFLGVGGIIASMRQQEKIVFAPDIQCPEHDPRAIKLFCKIVKEHIKPDRIIYLGDVINFDIISRFTRTKPAVTMETELKKLHGVFAQIKEALPKKCKAQLIQGNHEARLPKKLWENVPEVANLFEFSLRNVLRLDEFSIEGPFNRIELCGKRFVAVHGDPYSSIIPGAVARKWLEIESRSGISGHSHTLCSIGKATHSGGLVWHEGGSLCLNPQEYLNERLGNWSLGFCWGFFNKNDFSMFEVRYKDHYSWRSPEGKEFRV